MPPLLMSCKCILTSPSKVARHSRSIRSAISTLLSRSYTVTPSTSPPQTISPPLANKTILITGASRGIGAEIARRFAREGGTCVLVGRNETLLNGVRDELVSVGESGNDNMHRVIVGDIGKEEFWTRMRKEKGIHVLVNAAGITHYSPLFVTTPSLIYEMVQTNLVGTMQMCKTIGRNMMGSKDGKCIINVASLLGLKGGRGSAAYAASKAGVIGLTRALAAELGEKNIRVNVLVPGYIETDMTDAMTPAARTEALNSIPMRRFGLPSEIADAALFLATNKYANNCVLNLDGGLSAM